MLGGRTALVTGAGRRRGIGRAIALALARDGADVVVHGSKRRPQDYPPAEREVGWRGAASVAEEIVAMGRRALAVDADLGEAAAPGALVAEATAALGPVTVLVNNAAMAGTTGTDTIAELDDHVWHRAIEINLNAVYRICKAALPGMVDAGGGTIVNISSLAGIKPRARFGAYPASKAAVIALTHQIAVEFAPHVNANCVCPGSTETDMLDGTFARRDEQAGAPPGTWREMNISSIPMRRQGQPEDIAAAVSFFASPAAAFTTGQVLSVDGGQDLV